MERGRESFSSGQRTLLSVAALVILLAGMKEADSLVASGLLALVIAVAVTPLQQWLAERVGRVVAFLLTLAGVFLAILAVTALLGVGLAALVAELAQMSGRADDLYREAMRMVAGTGLDPRQLTGLVEGQQVESGQTLFRVAGVVLETVANFGLVVFLALFMLADATRLPEKADALKRFEGGAVVERLKCLAEDVRSYLKINAATGLASGLGVTGLLLLLQVPLAPLWGVLTVLLKFVPAIGLWVALIPPVLLAAFGQGLYAAIAVGVGGFVVNQVADMLLRPRLVSTGLRLSPFTLVFSIVFWVFILGPLGTILAVPLTLAVRQLLVEPSEELGWLSVLMATRVERAKVNGKPAGKK